VSPQPLISEALAAFIREHIASVEHLEILLLLFRDRERYWTAAQAAHQLRLEPSATARRLEQLSGRFLDVRVAAEPQFRFDPRNAEREAMTAALAAAAQQVRSDVVRVILAGDSALRAFADAFRLRKDS
jgi:hypothetical protein